MLVKLIFVLIAFTTRGNACPKPMANLIVVNFTKSKLLVYIQDKKIGNIGKQNQKNFKKKLPVGAVNLKIKKANVLVYEENFTIADEGKDTCKRNKPVILKDS